MGAVRGGENVVDESEDHVQEPSPSTEEISEGKEGRPAEQTDGGGRYPFSGNFRRGQRRKKRIFFSDLEL